MTTLSKDEVISLIDFCGLVPRGKTYDAEPYERFAALCRSDLVEENETLRYEVDAIAGIKAERDAWAKDAERYRFLANSRNEVRYRYRNKKTWYAVINPLTGYEYDYEDSLGEAIDAAMKGTS